MAYNSQNFQFGRGETTTYAQGQGVTSIQHSYKSATDTRATIAGVGYFPGFAGSDADKVFIGDSLFIVASDGESLVMFTSMGPVTLGPDLLVSGPTLSVGLPIAPVDDNGVRISGNLLQMELATIAHPGSVSTATQTFSGTKTFVDGVNGYGVNAFGAGLVATHINATGAVPLPIGDDGITTSVDVTPVLKAIGGIQADAIEGNGAATMVIASNVGGNPTTLILGSSTIQTRIGNDLYFINGGSAINYYAEASGTFSWTGAFTAPQTVSAYFRRQNDTVTLIVKGMTAPAAAGVGTSTADSGAFIPAAYRPLADTKAFVLADSNGTVSDSYCVITSAGVIHVYADSSASLFANAGNNRVGDISVSYVVV